MHPYAPTLMTSGFRPSLALLASQTMRLLLASVAAMALLVACGGADDEGSVRSSTSGPTTTTEATTTTADPDEAFLAAVDDARLRHGFDDAELVEAAEGICEAADTDSTGPTDTRAGTSYTSAEINRLYAGTNVNPFPMPLEDAIEIAFLAGEHLCPDRQQEISHGADLAEAIGG